MQRIYKEIEEKTAKLKEYRGEHPDLSSPFQDRLDRSWIYHDHALEGIVLSYHELNSAIDDEIISEAALIPQYDDIRNYKVAIALARTTAARRRPVIGLDYFKKLHHILSEAKSVRPSPKAHPKPPPGQYRKDNPLHRLYFHDIAAPEKISYHVRKLVQWLVSDDAKKLHPIKRAAFAHHKLISIFPWPRYSGKIARLLMNTLLLRDGFLPAIVHAVERQQYYEVLKASPDALTELVASALVQTLDSSLQSFEGLAVSNA